MFFTLGCHLVEGRAKRPGQGFSVVACHRQPGALRWTVRGESTHDDRRPWSEGLSEDLTILPPVFLTHKKVEHRPVVPDVVPTGWLPCKEVMFNPLHALVRAHSRTGLIEGDVGDVEHREVRPAL